LRSGKSAAYGYSFLGCMRAAGLEINLWSPINYVLASSGR
jgi:hypothetical protein